MKKTYMTPEIEVKAFSTEDIITASGTTTTPTGLTMIDNDVFDISNAPNDKTITIG